jgi:hypothetical protein
MGISYWDSDYILVEKCTCGSPVSVERSHVSLNWGLASSERVLSLAPNSDIVGARRPVEVSHIEPVQKWLGHEASEAITRRVGDEETNCSLCDWAVFASGPIDPGSCITELVDCRLSKHSDDS